MLVLTRSKEEGIMIGDDIEVRVLDVRGERVRLGVIAPEEVSIHRKEVFLAIQKENRNAAQSSDFDLDQALKGVQKPEIKKLDEPHGKE